MARKLRVLTYWLLFFSQCLLILSLVGCEGHIVGVLNPKGFIAYQERRLFFDTLALMMIVVLPVIVMSIAFIFHYRVSLSHSYRDYKPNWSHSYFLEALWWGIPCLIIVVLAILTFKKTHQLDPYRNIDGSKQNALIIEVIALPWKWLFIYPQQHIASINYLMLPLGRQVEFLMTTDNVPMSSFFIPQLGSQIYAMAGMRSQLHLIATQLGDYEGLNSQFNGAGFSDMHFGVHVVAPAQFEQWLTQMQQAPKHLNALTYNELLRPSMAAKVQFFSDVPTDLFKNVIATYMHTFGTEHPRAYLGIFRSPTHKE